MQQMQSLIENLLIFLIFIFIGFILRSKNKVSPNLQNDLGYILTRITLPFLIFSAIAKPFDQALIKQGIGAFVLMAVCYVIGSIVGFIFMKLFQVDISQRGVWMLGATFSNMGFMGFPVINAMYGSDGLFLTSFASIAFNLTYYTLGIMMVKDKREKEHFDWKGVFINNIMLSIVLGLFFFAAKIQVEGFFAHTISLIGGLTTPLSMLIIGLKLSEFPLKSIFNDLKLYQMCLVRLLIVPLITVFLFKLMPFPKNSLMVTVIIILNAMPLTANSTIITSQYGGDVAFAAKATTLSSILCLITLPIILYLI